MIKYRTCYRSSPNALFSFRCTLISQGAEASWILYTTSSSLCKIFIILYLLSLYWIPFISLRQKSIWRERKKEKKKEEGIRILDLKSNRLNVNNRDNESTGISLKKIWRNVWESNIFFPFEIRKKTKGERIKNEKSYDK